MDMIDTINYYYYELADPRIRDDILLRSVWPSVLIIFSYLYFIFQCGPRFMKDRPAYELKTFIRFYNIFQIVTNAFIVKETFAAYPYATAFQCVPITYQTDTASMRALNACYYATLLKIVDLIETGVFVLRKKKSQITILHLYHHISTVSLGLIFLRYLSSGMALFFPALNCAVHVIMYSYYFLSNLNGSIKTMVVPLKRYITIIQMVQFGIMAIQLSIAVQQSCPAPKLPAVLMFINLFFNFGLFYNFYRKTYLSPQKKKDKET